LQRAQRLRLSFTPSSKPLSIVVILGLSAFYHDSGAALVQDGEIIAAAQEERFTRHKHDAEFPEHAINYCLQEAGITLNECDKVIFYDKPFLKFERLLETYATLAPRGFKSFRLAMPLWVKEKLFLKSEIIKALKKLGADDSVGDKVGFNEHHLSHAASAFFPSPFEHAGVLTMDGVGEWATTSIAEGHGKELIMRQEIHFPHSLGLLYSAFTYYCGFKVNSGEYKLMGLAPYGEPKYAQLIRDHLIDLREDGSFQLDLSYFDYATGLTMINERFERLFDLPTRKAEERLEGKHMDLAASIQQVTEEAVLTIGRHIRDDLGMKNLCLAGGVALNCVANGKLLAEGIFDQIWIQPASGDAGGALGAALSGHFAEETAQRVPVPVGQLDHMKGAYLGPEYSDADIRAHLEAAGAVVTPMDEASLLRHTATRLAEGDAIGWFQGRMEFGPRALGARSILGDPRSPKMQSTLNLKVKFRESFRPFAPSVLREHVSEYFEIDADSPYMLLVAPIKESRRRAMSEEEKKLFGIEKLNVPRSDIPAVTHVDYSARVQTVHPQTNPRYYDLISRFQELTGCAVLVNTSFNIRGEPIVCTPEDAFRCLMGTDLDGLAIGNYFVAKVEQDPALKQSYQDSFELD